LTSTDDGATTWFGRAAYTVQTDSMSPTFEKGDLIFVETEFNIEDIGWGDIITYQAFIDVDGDGENEWVYNSHRVISVEISQSGSRWFYTQGDNNLLPDEDYTNQSYVIGVYTGDHIKNLGGILDAIIGFIKSGTGFFLFIVLPSFAFLVYEIYRFVVLMTAYKTQQTLADRVKMQEEALAAAKVHCEAEALEKAKKEKEE